MKKNYTNGMMEIQNLLDRIAEKEKHLYNKDNLLWDILTALRGPDDASPGLKFETAEKLRQRVCPLLTDSVKANFNQGPIHLTPYPASQRLNIHFALHWEKAVCALRSLGFIPEVIVPLAKAEERETI